MHITPPQATSTPVSTQPGFSYFGAARRIRPTFTGWGNKGKTDNLEGDLEDPNPTQPPPGTYSFPKLGPWDKSNSDYTNIHPAFRGYPAKT